jgi:hypothetical protein
MMNAFAPHEYASLDIHASVDNTYLRSSPPWHVASTILAKPIPRQCLGLFLILMASIYRIANFKEKKHDW